MLLMLSFFERWLVYPAPRHTAQDWVAADLPHEDVYFSADDGTKLHGWYVPHAKPRGVMLFAHGNGEHVARLAPLLKLLHDLADVSVFAWDYRGYGRSEGKPHEDNVLADARTAQLWLAERGGVRPEDVIVYGRSLGGAVAVGLASQYPVRGMVLERTFADLVETAAHHFRWLPVRLMMKNRFPSIERITTYRGPLFQSHGTEDEVVPFAMGKKLFDAATTENKKFFVVEGGNHNGPQPEEYYKALGEFLDSLPEIKAAERVSANVNEIEALEPR
ncbi:MAG: alpha/beta fold hydrolase [Pirellulales bacterium]|nr:alpha/beta fold hydrolase [Pirellulales bacterium]